VESAESALVAPWLQVRPEFPAPQPGQLPLPRSLPAALQQQLTGELPGWQQLPWPAGGVPQQPQPNPKAALQFKVSQAGAVPCCFVRLPGVDTNPRGP
jgi:hypothetical protein